MERGTNVGGGVPKTRGFESPPPAPVFKAPSTLCNWSCSKRNKACSGLEIATHWSPMRPEIKRWRLDF